LTTAVAGIIAKKFGPGIGGLFLAFPAIFPASATLIEKHEREKKNLGLRGAARGRSAASLDAAGSSMGSIGLFVFAFVVSQFMLKDSAWIVLGGSTLLWLGTSVAVWKIRKARHRIQLSRYRSSRTEASNQRRRQDPNPQPPS
jgi:hypothetical protein